MTPIRTTVYRWTVLLYVYFNILLCSVLSSSQKMRLILGSYWETTYPVQTDMVLLHFLTRGEPGDLGNDSIFPAQILTTY